MLNCGARLVFGFICVLEDRILLVHCDQVRSHFICTFIHNIDSSVLKYRSSIEEMLLSSYCLKWITKRDTDQIGCMSLIFGWLEKRKLTNTYLNSRFYVILKYLVKTLLHDYLFIWVIRISLYLGVICGCLLGLKCALEFEIVVLLGQIQVTVSWVLKVIFFSGSAECQRKQLKEILHLFV